LRDGAFRIIDQGALPFVIAARVETAIKRALPETTPVYLPEPPSARSQSTERMRRTRLYLPGNEPKFFPNAGLHRPDGVVLDLEDSVAPQEKDAARILVRNALRVVDFHGAERTVRINRGPLGLDDIRAVVPQYPDAILIPKCEDAETVMTMEEEIRSAGKKLRPVPDVLLIPIIESPLGIVNAYAIASASRRVCALAIGLEDYTAELGVERTAGGAESLFARMTIVNAAKAAGLQALDSVYSDVEDLDGLRASTLESRTLGFDGRGCIHPRQIRVIHEALAPTLEQIGKAKLIVEAAETARKNGTGVIALGSKMIDVPVVLRAERILRLAGELGKAGTDQ
jgi:citrate lyase subunit beta/citryl-CoA lyase